MFALQNKTLNTRVMQKTILFIILSFLLFSCGGKKQVQEEDLETKKAATNPQTVEVQVISMSDFNRQLFSNGILHAARKAELRFQASGILKKLNIANGQKTAKGYLLAALDNKKQKIALDQAREQITATELDLNSELISHGGKVNDTASVSPEMLKNLKIKCGYNRAVNQLRQAQLDYYNTFLRAPFTGIISGLTAQPYNIISTSDIFCKLLDNSSYKVEFTILESEAARIHKDMKVTVVPFAGDTLKLSGTITEINPAVDKNGLITAKAAIINQQSQLPNLYDGMNVRVVVENIMPDLLVISKEALVLRSNRKVVFTYENGLAKWNYVETSFENSTQYVIIKGLNQGDSVIVKGNLNLAHDAKIKLQGE